MIKLVEKVFAQSLLPTNPEQAGLKELGNTLLFVKNLLLGLAGGIAVIFIIYGGILYLTAYGNEERASQGKKTVYWAVVGVVVILLAEIIISLVWSTITPEPMPTTIP